MAGLHSVKKAFEFFKSKEGQRITVEEIGSATGWKLATVRTYIAKNWKGLLHADGDSHLVRGFARMTEAEFLRLHSQVAPVRAQFEYDVGLSFAGEDRDYVEEVASTLRAYDIVVFYDNFERANLWGKDLYV